MEGKFVLLPGENRFVKQGIAKNQEGKLISFGISPQKAHEWANSRKAYWRIAKSPVLHIALGIKYWTNQGLRAYPLDMKFCDT